MATKRVLVYGGKGALGSACVKLFKSKNYVSVVTGVYVRACERICVVLFGQCY